MCELRVTAEIPILTGSVQLQDLIWTDSSVSSKHTHIRAGGRTQHSSGAVVQKNGIGMEGVNCFGSVFGSLYKKVGRDEKECLQHLSSRLYTEDGRHASLPFGLPELSNEILPGCSQWQWSGDDQCIKTVKYMNE